MQITNKYWANGKCWIEEKVAISIISPGAVRFSRCVCADWTLQMELLTGIELSSTASAAAALSANTETSTHSYANRPNVKQWENWMEMLNDGL